MRGQPRGQVVPRGNIDILQAAAIMLHMAENNKKREHHVRFYKKARLIYNRGGQQGR